MIKIEKYSQTIYLVNGKKVNVYGPSISYEDGGELTTGEHKALTNFIEAEKKHRVRSTVMEV